MLTKEEVRNIVFDNIRSHSISSDIGVEPATFAARFGNDGETSELLLEVLSELLAEKILYQSHSVCPLAYRVSTRGKQVIFDNWTIAQPVEMFISELKKKDLIFSSDLETLICEACYSYEEKHNYASNLCLTLAAELALEYLNIDLSKQESFGDKIKFVRKRFEQDNLARSTGKSSDLTISQADLMNFAFRMQMLRNAYAHLKPTKFNFEQERQDFVKFLENVKKCRLS